MQTIDFIRTAKWLVDQYAEDTKVHFLRGAQIHTITRDSDERKRTIGLLLRSAADVAIVSERLNANESAIAILKAFGIGSLLERDFAIRMVEPFLDKPPELEHPYEKIDGAWRAIWDGWWHLTHCIEPIEKLTIPPAVAEETDFDDILTLELRYDGDQHPKAETLAEALRHADLLYSSIARSFGLQEYQQLVVIFADSGSSVRIDLRGLGEPIREAKAFLVELWNRFRHRKADDYRANAEALLSGLKVIETLQTLQQKGAITGETATRCRHDILNSGIALFESGALPREVPRVELVSNQKILTDLQRKLLTAAPEVIEAEHSTTTGTQPARRSPRKSTKKTRKKSRV